MKLGIKERIQMNGIYPKEGNILEQMTVKGILKKTEITEKESTAVGLKVLGEGKDSLFTWDKNKKAEIKVEFDDKEKTFLKSQIDKMDKTNKITQSNLELCLMIKDL